VEGDNKTRILFSTTDLGCQFPNFPVLSSKDGKMLVPAGGIHGVNKKTLFTIKSGDDRFEGLKPVYVLPLSSRLRVGENDGIYLKKDLTAFVTKWNLPHKKVFVQQSSSGPSDSRDFVISHSPDGRMKLERRDKLIPRYAKKDIYFIPCEISLKFSTPNTHTSDTGIIDAVTRFNFHLFQTSSNGISVELHVKLERLSTDGDGQPVKDGKDFFASSKPVTPAADIKVDPVKIVDLNALYGFTLSVDNPGMSLYPYVFAFDPATYEIVVREFL
jgi:hypothetical protein